MSRYDSTITDDVRDLFDGYLAGELDEAGFAALELALRESAGVREYFVRYCKLETDLHAMVRAEAALSRALASIGDAGGESGAGHETNRPRRLWWPRTRLLLLAASIFLMFSGYAAVWFARPRNQEAETLSGNTASSAEVAWIINAHDCQWDPAPAGGLVPGRILSLRQGLAELRMASGATIVVEGPAQLELVGRDAVRVGRGKIAVRAEGNARGFQVLLPQGRVIDLGTEFGISVEPDGGARVVVFEGKVEAWAEAGQGGGRVTLIQMQSARVSRDGVKIESAASATTQPLNISRQIKPTTITVARRARIDFSQPAKGTLLDANGLATGLTHRLPGTGGHLPDNDPNLRIETSSGSLRLTTTRSDLNHRFKLSDGEYLGLRLSDLGFTGDEDFEVSVVVPNIPGLAAVGQFGLYAGARNDLCIRGGLISQRAVNRYSQFFVNNESGIDQNVMYVGLIETGNDVRLSLRRRAGSYSLTIENLSSGASSTLSIRPLAALTAERQIYVGFFGANTGSEERQTLSISELSATVWTKQ